jgi:hypothetical protein
VGQCAGPPLECDGTTLHAALRFVLDQRRGQTPIDCRRWLSARFAPSSSILDAAISLYGQHDVSAIAAHAAPVELIDQCAREVADIADNRDTMERTGSFSCRVRPAPARPWSA